MKDRWVVLLMEEFHVSLVNHLWHSSKHNQVHHIQSCRICNNNQEHISGRYQDLSGLLCSLVQYLKEGMEKCDFLVINMIWYITKYNQQD